MARIERIELRLVDIPPKVRRTDAIQSFVSQETPIVAITDSDGAIGTGYSYTIGTGGSSVMRLFATISRRALSARRRNGSRRSGATWSSRPTRRPSARSRRWRWRRSTSRCGTSAASGAALPLWIVAGGAADRRPLYTTEGGWLHIDERALVEDAWRRARRASSAPRSRSAGRMSRRTAAGWRRCARRSGRTTRS